MTSVSLPACLVPTTADVVSGAEWQQRHATWLYRGMLDATIIDHGRDGTPTPHAVTVHELGHLPLPTGRVDAGDLHLAGGEGYEQPLPVGDHLCVVAEGTIEAGHQRVMAALLLTGPEPIVRWTEGFTEEPAGDLAPGDYHGFPIDSGLAAFLSPTGPDQMIDEIDEDAFTQFEANGFDGALMHTVSGQPVAAFASGWGDGHYPTWFGLAADGSVSVVMADFFVFDDPFPVDDDEPGDDDERVDDEPVPDDEPVDEPVLAEPGTSVGVAARTGLQPLIPARPTRLAEATSGTALAANLTVRKAMPLTPAVPNVRMVPKTDTP